MQYGTPIEDLTLEKLCAQPVFLATTQENGYWIPTRQREQLVAKPTSFSFTTIGEIYGFQAVENGLVRIFSHCTQDYVSCVGGGIDVGWPLWTQTFDPLWSKFKLTINPDNTIYLQMPAGSDSYVSVIGEKREIKAAEAAPTPWSKFRPYRLTIPA